MAPLEAYADRVPWRQAEPRTRSPRLGAICVTLPGQGQRTSQVAGIGQRHRTAVHGIALRVDRRVSKDGYISSRSASLSTASCTQRPANGAPVGRIAEDTAAG